MPNFVELIDVLPHYLAMLVLVYVSLDLLRTFLGVEHLLVDLVVVLLIVFLYRPLVIRIGIAPTSWDADE